MPTVNKEKIIGVRTPALRVFAKKYGKTDEAKEYLQILPHQYYEENNLHGLLIEQIKDYDTCLEELERFLPYIDNWATCDMLAVKVVKKHLDTFIDEVYRWMESDRAYTIRFGISMLMRYYLEDAFQMEYPEKVAQIRSEEYYVNMMRAWYFATALAKQYDKILPFVEKQKLDVWTHNKTIQKAIESYRITPEQKEYLRGLKIKNEIRIHLYDHKKSEYRTAAKTGTSVIRKRTYFLKMREWELESMKALTAELETCMEDVYALRFFYSFQIPRLGKEFDLLQIKEDQIVNIELKSGVVSDEAICRQLLQNRYYLSVLGRTIHSYTYISSQNRLVRLTNHDHIAEADWDELCRALKRESPDYDGNIEELFRAELYLISPLREPERFYRKNIF